MKKTILWTILALAICLNGCGGSDDWIDLRENFVAKTADLTKAPAKTELATDASIKGKIVVFTNEGNGYSVSDIFFDDLKSVYARKPEEVGTVALINCKKEKAGVYVSKINPQQQSDAFKSNCELTLVDRAAQTAYFKKSFEAPVKEEARGQGNYVFAGAETLFEIRNFLKEISGKNH